MTQQITQGIKVSINTRFEGTYIFHGIKKHVFSYVIKIENQSKDVVQLVARHWNIKDALNENDLVYGEGVVGKKPVIKPGSSHTYSSSCHLTAPFGAMSGYYEMINFTTTKKMRINIPSFRLNAPYAMS